MKYITLLTCILLTFSCSGDKRNSSEGPPSHKVWNNLLKSHVNKNGMVDYEGFIKDKDKLETYLELLSNNAPDKKTWSREDRLAYWINAYNAFTIKLIVDNYPVKSIQDLHPTFKIPGVNTVWHKKFFKIGGQECSLDEIEHDILRNEFNEPKIHFAINCASFSCPPLRNEAFFADRIEGQLEGQARNFINDHKRNQINKDYVVISKIFSWFTKDFTKNGSLVDFLNEYSNKKINPDAEIDYMKYDWRLNDVKR